MADDVKQKLYFTIRFVLLTYVIITEAFYLM
jgi:hypothetical protein